jgi:iron-sulfur cluster repair protein YtfE (RIC family)
VLDDDIRTLDLDIALANVIVHVKGRVVFKKTTKKNSMEVGIQFIDVTDEIAKKLSNYIIVFFDETGKPKNLIRERVMRIDNVVLTLSKEHKIINDYVIEYRKMLENPDHDLQVQDLDTLFDLMERDLIRHFQFEEQIIFAAVLAGEQNSTIVNTVDVLQREHGVMLEQLNSLIADLKMLLKEQQNVEHDSTEKDVLNGSATHAKPTPIRGKIDSFMDLMKKHARNEIENIFPVIDSDHEKMSCLNELLSKFNLSADE